MYCKKCNGKIPDNVKFCPRCGSPVEDSELTEDSLKQEPSKSKKSKKNILRNTLITVIACAAVVAVVLLLVLLPRENLVKNEEGAAVQSEIEAEDTVEIAEESLAENGAEIMEESKGNFEPSEEYEYYSDPNKNPPRLYLSYAYSLILDGTIDGQDVWDFFVADEMKATRIESEFVNYWDVLEETDHILSYMSTSYNEDAENGRYKVSGISIRESTGIVDTTDYIVIENGQYKLTYQY